jgi:hypothetical protein
MAETKRIGEETPVIGRGMTEWVIFKDSPLQELLENERNKEATGRPCGKREALSAAPRRKSVRWPEMKARSN